MNKINSIEWYRLQPLGNGQYYGTIKDWNQTLATVINKANALLTKIPVTPKPKRKLIIGNNLIEVMESLEYYDSIISRYNVAYSKDINADHIHMIEGDLYVEIITINKHKPANK